ncbi:hypothetical protein WJX77_002700 [Trebouxia sp. C0004]
MALDERRLVRQTELQESLLIAERQKAVMFATLNRARQTLEDQGAQPQPVDAPDKAARSSIAFPPFLWMPHSPAGTTQQGLPRASSQGTVSANVGLRSVNQLHGLTSPSQNAVSGSQASAAQAEAGLQWQHLSSKDAAAAGSSKPENGLHPACQTDRQQQPFQTAHPAQQDSPSLPQHASSMDHAAHQQPQCPCHGSVTNTSSVVGRLNGVRMVEGGWQARLGHGRSKSKQSLGTYPTEYAAARAYDSALLIHRPAFEVQNNLNFPVSDYAAASDPYVSRAATAAVSQLQRIHANKRRRQWPESHSSPLSSARQSQHRWSEHIPAAQPFSRAHLQPPAKKPKHDQPMSDADHSSSAKAAAGLGADADADSFSASYSTLQSQARTDSLNSRRKNLDGRKGVNSSQARQHPHRVPVGADSSEPVCRGQGDVASQGAGLRAQNLPTETEPGRDQDQGAVHTVKQRTPAPFAPFSSSEQAQHIPTRLSKQPSTASAGLAAADPSQPVGMADMAAERADSEAHQADHTDEPAHDQAERAQHAVSRATPTGSGPDEQTAREHDDQPSTAPPDEPALSTQMGPAPAGLHALNQHPELQQAEPSHLPHTSHQSSSAHPPLKPQTLPHGLSSQPQQQPQPPGQSTQAASLHAAVQQHQHAPLASSKAVKPPIHLNTVTTDPAGRTGIASKAAYAVGPVTADPMCRGFAPQPAEPADGQEAEAIGGQSPEQGSPEVVETVRAGDSDDDVEIMDDSPVRPSADMLFPCSPDALAGLSPQPEQPVPQHRYFDHQQQQRQPAEQRQQQTQQQQQQESCGQPPWEKADLSMLSNLASKLVAQHRQVQHPNDAITGVKLEARSQQSHDSAHMPGCQNASAVAGSTSDHPVELSESDGGSKLGSDTSSNASSSVDPSQRVPAPWMHADTAASGQSRHQQMPESGYTHAHGQTPQSGLSDAHGHMPQSGDSTAYGLPARVLLRQQSQNSSPTNGQLRTKRGLQHEAGAAVGPKSKLARTSHSGTGVRGGGNSSKTGATAAEAVNLSDDDDDVVIIEEGMQPQSATTAPAKQPGAPIRPRFVPRQAAAASSRSATAAAAVRSALYSPSTSTKPPPTSCTFSSTSAVHSSIPIRLVPDPACGPHAPAAPPSSSSAAAAAQAEAGPATAAAQAEAGPATAAADMVSGSAADSVAELRRTEQQSDVGFKAAQELEWQKREAEINRQAEEARRLKRQRRAANEKAAKQQAQLGQRLAEHRMEQQRKEAEEELKEKLRVSIRHRLALQVGSAKSMHSVLRAFNIPIEGGFAPTQAQLQKAYKKATIMFHPDKHVRAGLQRQLEAEETFKIISHAGNRKPGR